MSPSNLWKTVPLRSCILAILERRGGVILESDLTAPLKEMYGDYSETELNKALMSLENQGLIHVTWVSKTRRRIQRISGDMGFLGVGED